MLNHNSYLPKTLVNQQNIMTSLPDNSNQSLEQIVEKAVTNAIAPLIEQIIQLQTTQSQNLNSLEASYDNFLKQLTESLNSKKSSSLEPTLQKLTEALQMVSFQLKEQRHSQEQLSNKIQQVLTAQEVIGRLSGKTQPHNNESPDNS